MAIEELLLGPGLCNIMQDAIHGDLATGFRSPDLPRIITGRIPFTGCLLRAGCTIHCAASAILATLPISNISAFLFPDLSVFWHASQFAATFLLFALDIRPCFCILNPAHKKSVFPYPQGFKLIYRISSPYKFTVY